jgi:HSP20 family molecular chaperone IbpA
MAERNEQAVARKESDRIQAPAGGNIVPPVDIYEDVDCVTLFADLPGVSKETLDVQVDKDTLKIYGKRAAGNGTEGVTRLYDEIPAKDFYRAFTIGEEIDREKISASMNNGVLKLTLPKAEKTKPKKIDIKIS